MTRGRLVSTVAAMTALLVSSACHAATPPDPTHPSSARAAAAPPRSSSDPTPRAVVGSPDADPPAPAAALPSTTRPVRLQIPAIGVDSSLESLAVEKDGSLAPPSKYPRAGWYADGTRPGDTGPAVIAGHVDSTSGPAVFFRLGSLHAGDRVYVTRADRQRIEFVVDAVREYPKRVFPTEAVYGPTSLPVLRLVTCSGDFDARTGSYLDNLVVTSHRITP